MPSAIKQAVLAVVQAYEADFEESAKEIRFQQRRFRIMSSGSAIPDKIPSYRITEILQLYDWIEDEKLSDVAFQELLENHVNTVMQSGTSVFGLFTLDMWPDSLMTGLRQILQAPAFASDNLRLIEEAKKASAVKKKSLDAKSVQSGLLKNKEAEVARYGIENKLLRERNHGLFEVNRDLSKTLGIAPSTPAEIDAALVSPSSTLPGTSTEITTKVKTKTTTKVMKMPKPKPLPITDGKSEQRETSVSPSKRASKAVKKVLGSASTVKTLFKSVKAVSDTSTAVSTVVSTTSATLNCGRK